MFTTLTIFTWLALANPQPAVCPDRGKPSTPAFVYTPPPGKRYPSRGR